MGKISLPTLNQVQGSDALRIFKEIGSNSYATDLSILGGSSSYLLEYNPNDKKDVLSINKNGAIELVGPYTTNIGIRPVFNFSQLRGIPINNGKFKVINDTTIEIEYGYYSQKRVPYEIIKDQSPSNMKTADFRLYSSNSIYEIEGNKYVDYTIYDPEGFTFIEEKNRNVFQIEPVKWFVDLKENIMIAEKTLLTTTGFHPKSNFFDKKHVSSILNNVFGPNLMRFIENEQRLDIKEVKRKIANKEAEIISIEELKRQLNSQSNYIYEEDKRVEQEIPLEPTGDIKPQADLSSTDNEEKRNSKPCVVRLHDSSRNTSFSNNYVTMSGKFIQVVFNNKSYSFPLDDHLSVDIRMQDDINFVYDFNNNIVRKSNSEEETFRINNALKRAYINRLNKIPLSEKIKIYINRYDVNMEYKDSSSITTIEKIVDELACIYYKEFTSKNINENAFQEVPSSVNLDEYFDDEYYTENKISHSK